MKSKELIAHRITILDWAIAQLPTKTRTKSLQTFEDLVLESTVVSLEQSLFPDDYGYDLAFGIVKERLKYLLPKNLKLLPDLSSSPLIRQYVSGTWINKDKMEAVEHLWYYLFFPPFRLGYKFNNELVSSILKLFNTKSPIDIKATIKYINQLPASAYIMAVAPPIKRTSFSTRWVIYGMNFREIKQLNKSLFQDTLYVPAGLSKFNWKEMGLIISIKNGQLLPDWGLEFILSKKMNISKIISMLKLLNVELKGQKFNFTEITEWIINNPTLSKQHPEGKGGTVWLNHIKCTVREGAVHSIKSYFGLNWGQTN